jgi:DNA-directed RNA polymerase specialized sigma24 family protein
MDPTLLWATIEESSMVNNSKEALLLKFRDGLSIRDIAERLDISESAIKMRILRGKKYLKKSFNNNIDY